MIELDSQTRDILMAKVGNSMRRMSNDHLIAMAIVAGYSLADIDALCRQFTYAGE